jgi:hypothetical protein
MTTEDVDDPTAAYRELREYARGTLDVDHDDVSPIAGLIDDDEVREVLTYMASVYDPSPEDIEAGMPRDFWGTEWAQRAIEQYATETAQEAIREGDLATVSYITGLPSYKSDVSGLHAINQLVDWLVHSERCKLVYLAALMGRGKTDLSLTMMEVIADHYDRLERSTEEDVAVPEFAANFAVETPSRSRHSVKQFSRYDRLKEWADQGSSDDVRWFIFDEASTELTAQSGSNAQKVAERFAPFVKKMRKKGVNMIVIGHDKGDVHPAVRSLADFVDKQGLKTASFYAGIKNREPAGHLFDLDGIPKTGWEFDTDDTADWSWGEKNERVDEDSGMSQDEFKSEVAERAARLWVQTPDDVTQADIARAVSTDDVSVSNSTISRYAERLEMAANDEPSKATL